MSQYYKAKRSRNIYDPNAEAAYKLSRSKIDLFLNCARCFFLDRRLGVGRPPGYPFNLNSAVDTLLKKEFDLHRVKKVPHPLMKKYGIKAVPFQHPDLNKWRENFVGVQHLHLPTNFIITGALDDVWVNSEQELIVVDYKATAKDAEVNIDAPWQIGYKRQMEVYQWLLRQNGFKVSNTGYFVYANGRTDKKAFDAKLEFNVTILPYSGNTNWIEQTLTDIKNILGQQELPSSGPDCDYCPYRAAVHQFEIGGDVC